MKRFDPPFERCLLCGSEKIYKYHQTSDGIIIFRCKDCGIQFMNPQYSEEYLADFYSKYYSSHTKDTAEYNEVYSHAYNFYFDRIEKYNGGKGKLLDVGTGKGQLLKTAMNRGWRGEGYEIDCVLSDELAAKLGVPVRCGRFEKLGWKDSEFDCVAMHHVLEHLKDPVIYLNSVKRILRSGGIFFLALPNIGSLSSGYKFRMEKLGIKKNKIGSYYDTGHHLWYYTPSTLRRTLANFGFEVLYMRSGHKVYPGQTSFSRVVGRNITEKNLLHSSFICFARKSNELSMSE